MWWVVGESWEVTLQTLLEVANEVSALWQVMVALISRDGWKKTASNSHRDLNHHIKLPLFSFIGIHKSRLNTPASCLACPELNSQWEDNSKN